MFRTGIFTPAAPGSAPPHGRDGRTSIPAAGARSRAGRSLTRPLPDLTNLVALGPRLHRPPSAEQVHHPEHLRRQLLRAGGCPRQLALQLLEEAAVAVVEVLYEVAHQVTDIVRGPERLLGQDGSSVEKAAITPTAGCAKDRVVGGRFGHCGLLYLIWLLRCRSQGGYTDWVGLCRPPPTTLTAASKVEQEAGLDQRNRRVDFALPLELPPSVRLVPAPTPRCPIPK